MVKVPLGLKIEEEVVKNMKKHCIDADMDYSDYIENLVKKDLKK